MNGRRNVTRDIWRAVVMAGAMLGSTACSSSSQSDTTEPAPTEETTPAATDTETTDPVEPDTTMNPCGEAANPCGEAANPCGEAANPCGETAMPEENPCADTGEADPETTENPCARPRGNDDGPRGRGFILA